MLFSPAYAQSAGGGGGALEAMLPLVLIFIVFYFLLIRPQQKKMKDHKEMLGNIRRGDIVITGGGITGKVTKVDNDLEVTVEIAKDVKVKVQRSLISGVQVKGDPVNGGRPANENANQKTSGGGFGKLFGFGSGNKSDSNTDADPAYKGGTDTSNPVDEPAKNNSVVNTNGDDGRNK